MEKFFGKPQCNRVEVPVKGLWKADRTDTNVLYLYLLRCLGGDLKQKKARKLLIISKQCEFQAGLQKSSQYEKLFLKIKIAQPPAPCWIRGVMSVHL